MMLDFCEIADYNMLMNNEQMNNSAGMNGVSSAPGAFGTSSMPDSGAVVGGTQPMNVESMPGGSMPGVPMQAASMQYQTGPNGMPMVQQVQLPPEPEKPDNSGKIKVVIIGVMALFAVIMTGAFIWALMQYTSAKTDVEGQIQAAVNNATEEQAKKLEADFAEQEKYPYKIFSGPEDYGKLTFEYPRTWSVYVAAAATKGGDFNAYFNPIQVDAIGKDTINALRVTIKDKSFDVVSQEYQKAMEKKNANLSISSVMIGENANITANRYTGTIPDTELSGYIVAFKIRDKTAIVQTDSVLFKEDFDKLLATIEFNE